MGPTKLNQHLTFDPYSGLLAGVQTSDISSHFWRDDKGHVTRHPRFASSPAIRSRCSIPIESATTRDVNPPGIEAGKTTGYLVGI